jgi:hypothetical protein
MEISGVEIIVHTHERSTMQEPEEIQDHFVTLREAGDRFGYTPDYLGQLIRKGRLRGHRVYTNIQWMTTAEAMEEYLSLDRAGRRREGASAVHGTLVAGTERILSGRGGTTLLWLMRGLVAVLVVVAFLVLHLISVELVGAGRVDASSVSEGGPVVPGELPRSLKSQTPPNAASL